MIVISRKAGQLGNRLAVFAKLIAYAEETNTAIVNMAFYDYAHLFAEESIEKFPCIYPPLKITLNLKFLQNRLYHLIESISKKKIKNRLITTLDLEFRQRIYIDQPDFIQMKNDTKILCLTGSIQGIRFSDESIINKHIDKIKKYFKPAKKHEENIEKLLKKVREDADLVVGIHIRHGDYKTYEGGKYFYTFGQYAQVMKRISDLFPGRKTVFLICTNAKQIGSELEGLNYVMSTGHFIEDIYALAQCDYIAGPPSSYNAWASFYGEVPLLKIIDPAEEFDLSFFKKRKIPQIWDE